MHRLEIIIPTRNYDQLYRVEFNINLQTFTVELCLKLHHFGPFSHIYTLFHFKILSDTRKHRKSYYFEICTAQKYTHDTESHFQFYSAVFIFVTIHLVGEHSRAYWLPSKSKAYWFMATFRYFFFHSFYCRCAKCVHYLRYDYFMGSFFFFMSYNFYISC